MIIRTPTTHDAAVIRDLVAQLGYPGMTEQQANKKIRQYSTGDYALLVAEIGNKIVGFISLHWFDIFHSPGVMGRISAFCMDENYRSQGLGELLLKAGEDLLIAHGCTKIEVTSNISRTRTHQFYPKFGYTEDSKRFVKYPGKNSD